MRLSVHDDLMSGIDRSHPGIALDHAPAGGQLGTLVVGAIALPEGALRPAAIGRICRQPVAQLRGVLFEAREAGRLRSPWTLAALRSSSGSPGASRRR